MTTCCGLRNIMGAPWSTSSPQSAVDCFHAILDLCKVDNLCFQESHVVHVPLDVRKRREETITTRDGFRAHAAIAGIHRSLADVFFSHEIPPVSSDTLYVNTTLIPTHTSVLVFEVGRNDSTRPIEYGYITSNKDILLEVGRDKFSLLSVVCRRGGHYTGFIRINSVWYFYNDIDEGKLVECNHPELHPNKPSRYGELFFYE